MQFTKEQLNEVKKAYFFLPEFKKMLEETRKKQLVVSGQVINEYKNFVDGFNKHVPGILNDFSMADYRDRSHPFAIEFESFYKIDGLLIRVIKDLGTIKTMLETEESSPVSPSKDFSFVNDNNMKKIVERDYVWVNKCLAVEAWKPVILLSGGLIEALLLDALSVDIDKARSSSKAPKESDLKKWDFEDLINVAVDLSVINPGAEKLGDAVRHYRNLIHPGNELRTNLKVEPEEAKIAVGILNMIIRDLQNKK